MYSFNLNLKQCLMMITMLAFDSVHALPTSICDYPLEDIPAQILYVTIGSNDLMYLITRDLTVFELTKVNSINYVKNSSMAMKDKWPKLHDNGDFLAYKNRGFDSPIFGCAENLVNDTLHFATEKTNDAVTVLSYVFSDPKDEPKESIYKLDRPLDGIFSNQAIWLEITVTNDVYYVLQEIQGNFQFNVVKSGGRVISIDQGPYMCKDSKDREIVFSNDKCTNPWDDKVLKFFLDPLGSDHQSFYIFGEKQIYVYTCGHTPYDMQSPHTNYTALSYNRFFSCGHVESTLTQQNSLSNDNSAAILASSDTTDKSGLHSKGHIAIIIIIIVLVLIIGAIILLVVGYFLCYTQDKSAGGDKKKPHTSASQTKRQFSKKTSMKHSKDHKSGKAQATSVKGTSKAVGSKAKVPKVKKSKANKF